MIQPTRDTIRDYAPDETAQRTDDAIDGALAAELVSQGVRCDQPEPDTDWPADLAEALCRRVLHNLALRDLPLGVSVSLTEAGASQVRVGGLDAETRRLEAPYRKVVMG